MTSHNNFVWPTTGFVECPDWDDKQECGNGLHGWLYGHGDGSVSDYWSADSKWLVVSVQTDNIVDLKDKVKFKNGNVLFCGTQKEATDFLMKHETRSLKQPVIGAFVTVSHKETATTGDKGTSTSGNYGTSTSGICGTSTSGYKGTSNSGKFGTSISGNYGTSTSGVDGKCKAGKNGIINIYYFKNNRERLKTGYIGEDGLEPNTFYRLDDDFNFVKCD